MVSTTAKQVIAFSMLVIVMLTSFGLAHLPGSLQHHIQKNFNIDASQYGILFSVVNWAALLDVLHGYLLDRYLGIKLATFLYTSLVLIGSVLFCIAGYMIHFPLFLSGRTILGFGVNPIVLCTNKHIIYWFGKGKFINLVYGVLESIIWLGLSTCYFVSVNLLNFIARYRPPVESFSLAVCIEMSVLSINLTISSIVLAFMYGTKEDRQSDAQQLAEETKNLIWKDYLTLPWLFWTYAYTMFIYFIAIFSFLSMSQVFFEKTYDLTTLSASIVSGSISVSAFLLGAPFGYLMDKIGHNLTSFSIAIFLTITSHGLFSFTKWNQYIPAGIMAVSIGLSSSVWSQYQFLVHDYQYMIAYGVVQTGHNGALAVGTLMSGFIIDIHGYHGFMITIFGIIVSTIPVLIIIWILNYRRGNILNMTPKNKLIYLGRV